ncbi:MAG: hypothetical protein ACLP9L_31175 [Thermoguttaceae bacterium]
MDHHRETISHAAWWCVASGHRASWSVGSASACEGSLRKGLFHHETWDTSDPQRESLLKTQMMETSEADHFRRVIEVAERIG